MNTRLLKFTLALMLTLCVAAGAAAQSRDSDSAWLPVWNKASGKLEAYLVLEPAQDSQVDGRWRFGNNMLDATYGLDASDSLAVLCNGKGNFSHGLGQLPNNCLLATLGERLEQRDRRVTAGAAFSRNCRAPYFRSPTNASNDRAMSISPVSAFCRAYPPNARAASRRASPRISRQRRPSASTMSAVSRASPSSLM